VDRDYCAVMFKFHFLNDDMNSPALMHHFYTTTGNTSNTRCSRAELKTKAKWQRVNEESLAAVTDINRYGVEKNYEKLQNLSQLLSKQRHKTSNPYNCKPSRCKRKSIKFLNRLQKMDSSLRFIDTSLEQHCFRKKHDTSKEDRSKQFSEYRKEKISLWEIEKVKMRETILKDGKFRIVNGWIKPAFSEPCSAHFASEDIPLGITSMCIFSKPKNIDSSSCGNSMDTGEFSFWKSSQQNKTRESIVQGNKFRAFFIPSDISLPSPIKDFVTRKSRGSIDNGQFSLWAPGAA